MYIPNTITLINLAIGCLATMEAWNGRFATAAYFILISGVLDFMDGFAARMLRAYSDIGKQLDSLADLVSFGVAPAAIAAGLLQAGGITGVFSYLLPLLLPVFSAVRLARFNTEVHTGIHFNGMPVPADAAAFAALGLIFSYPSYSLINSILLHPAFIISLIIMNSWLMIAPLSMFSFKLKTYRPAANRWRYLYTGVSLLMIISLKAPGLFFVFLLYVLASIGMNIRLHDRGNRSD
jgi:CDP-diacylglycerol--serine O-phosphatidyltransferase